MPAASPAASPTADEGPLLYAHLFRARIPAIRDVLVAVERCLTPAGPDLASRTGLILAEMLNNIQQHGLMTSRPTWVALRLFRHTQAQGLGVVLIDDGRPIPPDRFRPPMPPPMPPPAPLPEGGFGWPLIHGLTADLHYRREWGCNILGFRVPP